MSKKPKQRLTKWFNGLKFYPGTSGVYKVQSKWEDWGTFSYFNAETKKWNGAWPSIERAYENRTWADGDGGHQGLVDYMIVSDDFWFRGLKDKP